MSAPIFKLKRTCDCCLHPVFDVACPCRERVERYRMSGACDCTCRTMAFKSCATTVAVDDCSCTDGTTRADSRITGAWIGFGDAATGHTLAEIALKRCPLAPTLTYELYGTTWNFSTHATEQDMNCLTDLTGLTLLWSGTDTPASPLSICDGGAIFLSAMELDIRDIATPGGTGTECKQEGGSEMFVMRVTDGCGNLLVLCPFAGVIGAQFQCQRYDHCCHWDITFITSPGDCEGSGAAHIVVTATRTMACLCPPTATLIFDPGGTRETSYMLTGTSMIFAHDITPCTPGESVAVLLRLDYLGCEDCNGLNGDYPLGPIVI